MEVRVFRSRGCIFAVLILLGLWICPVAFAQTNAVGAAETEMTPEQIELQKKLGAATASAQKDPTVLAAYQKLAKAMRELDDLLYAKIKQIDPSLKDYVDKLLKSKYPEQGN